MRVYTVRVVRSWRWKPLPPEPPSGAVLCVRTHGGRRGAKIPVESPLGVPSKNTTAPAPAPCLCFEELLVHTEDEDDGLFTSMVWKTEVETVGRCPHKSPKLHGLDCVPVCGEACRLL